MEFRIGREENENKSKQIKRKKVTPHHTTRTWLNIIEMCLQADNLEIGSSGLFGKRKKSRSEANTSSARSKAVEGEKKNWRFWWSTPFSTRKLYSGF
jgi:hypothetical protein